MYALTITHNIPLGAPPQHFEGGLFNYITTLANSDGPPPHGVTSNINTNESGEAVIRLTRYSNTLAVLERISSEFQDPTSNLYARHAWALENNIEITYNITEVDAPIDPLLDLEPTGVTPE
jgi:hypothetical protein